MRSKSTKNLQRLADILKSLSSRIFQDIDVEAKRATTTNTLYFEKISKP